MKEVLNNVLSWMQDIVYQQDKSKGVYNRCTVINDESAPKLVYRIEDDCIEAVKAAENIEEEGMDELGNRLADIVLQTMSVAGKLDLDIGKIIKNKLDRGDY